MTMLFADQEIFVDACSLCGGTKVTGNRISCKLIALDESGATIDAGPPLGIKTVDIKYIHKTKGKTIAIKKVSKHSGRGRPSSWPTSNGQQRSTTTPNSRTQ